MAAWPPKETLCIPEVETGTTVIAVNAVIDGVAVANGIADIYGLRQARRKSRAKCLTRCYKPLTICSEFDLNLALAINLITRRRERLK